MGIVSKRQLTEFIQAYVKRIEEYVSKYSDADKALIFPDYMLSPHFVQGYISKEHGIAIEFMEKVQKWRISIKEVKERVEDVVLPKVGDVERGFFVINGSSTVLENANLIAKDFYASHKDCIETFSKAANLIMDDIGWFLRIRSGDVKLINVGIGCIVGKREIMKNIQFLWIIGTNESQFFTRGAAEFHALQDFSRYLAKLIPKIPISLLAQTLEKFSELIHKEDIREEEIHEFLRLNPFLLKIGYSQVFSKPKLSEDLIPDFIIETTTGSYIVAELEAPCARLFTNQRHLPESKELRTARAQIERYLSFVKNNVLYLRQRFPQLSVEGLQGLIIIGLSSKMTDKEKERLRQLNYMSKEYQIITYDELASRMKNFLENLGARYGPFG